MKRIKIFIMATQILFSSVFGVLLSNSSIGPISSFTNELYILTSSDWSKAIVISDSSSGWNDDRSYNQDMVIDENGTIHVVWEDLTDGEWGSDAEIMYANYTSSSGWSNATVISDDYTGWNNGPSRSPSMTIDKNGVLHVVWHDGTVGPWGSDAEIMYTNHTASGWSNATMISDIYGWNDGSSMIPSIAVDNNINIHVIWRDYTDGEWGSDYEIMYANRTGSVWSNATVISDDNTGWNNELSDYPFVTVDKNGIVHAAWVDYTNGEWGNDIEIMYTNTSTGWWSNATVISDDNTQWNDGSSWLPNIAIDNNSVIHVVWHDETDGAWGTDTEIMYTNFTVSGWSNATVISDDISLWNTGTSTSPKIAVGINGTLHVVWVDNTPGTWGTDNEIMYAERTSTGWTKGIVISDDNTDWNNGSSLSPKLAIDNNSTLHVIWEDWTVGVWGGGSGDPEIMYSKNFTSTSGAPGGKLNLIPLLAMQQPSDTGLIIVIILIAVAATIILILIIIKKK